MRTFRCRLAVSALLALVLGDALAMGADVVKIGAVFEDSKEVIFDGTQTWGWAANHAEAAALKEEEEEEEEFIGNLRGY